eukprot:42679-Hanusia_phi.AAC.1
MMAGPTVLVRSGSSWPGMVPVRAAAHKDTGPGWAGPADTGRFTACQSALPSLLGPLLLSPNYLPLI